MHAAQHNSLQPQQYAIATTPQGPPTTIAAAGTQPRAYRVRVRWGRVSSVLLGLILTSVAAFGLSAGDPLSPTGAVPSPEPALTAPSTPAAPVGAPTPEHPKGAIASTGSTQNTTPGTPATVTPTSAAPKVVSGGGTSPARPAHPARTHAAKSHPATHVRRTVRGGGRASVSAAHAATVRASGSQLPYTGAPAWIAFLIGLVLIAAGGLVSVNADGIDGVARRYRRGPLLRPIWLARSCCELWRNAIAA